MGEKWVSEPIKNLGIYKQSYEEKQAFENAKERLLKHMLEKHKNEQDKLKEDEKR